MLLDKVMEKETAAPLNIFRADVRCDPRIASVRRRAIAGDLKRRLSYRPPVTGPAIRPQTVATVNAATQEDPAAATSP
jgi:hypothetical protein